MRTPRIGVSTFIFSLAMLAMTLIVFLTIPTTNSVGIFFETLVAYVLSWGIWIIIAPVIGQKE